MRIYIIIYIYIYIHIISYHSICTYISYIYIYISYNVAPPSYKLVNKSPSN